MLNDCFLGYSHCRKSIGVRGFFGHPKKKKNQVVFKIQKLPRREELAKKKRKEAAEEESY